MQYWLVKSEPEDYSIEMFEQEKSTIWTGVRNYTARNNLSMMKEGDLCIFYRSVVSPAAMGIVKVTKEFFQDPTTDEKAWVSVELSYVSTFNQPVSLKLIKQTPSLEKMTLLRISRLSVQPVLPSEFEQIVELGNKVTDKNGK